MKLDQLPVNCSLSLPAFEDVILQIRKSEPAQIVTLVVSTNNTFEAARLVTIVEDNFKARKFLETGFIYPFIDLVVNHAWRKYQWMVIADNIAIFVEGI
jgi:ABC-type arginine/histidine transport system permease subunit